MHLTIPKQLSKYAVFDTDISNTLLLTYENQTLHAFNHPQATEQICSVWHGHFQYSPPDLCETNFQYLSETLWLSTAATSRTVIVAF